MRILSEQRNGKVALTIFHIEGDVTAASYKALQQEAEEAYAGGMRDLLLDMTGVPFMDSAGLRAIHHIFMLLRSDIAEGSDSAIHKGIAAGSYRAQHLKLCTPNRDVLQALRLAGFDMFLEIHSSLKAAIASF